MATIATLIADYRDQFGITAATMGAVADRVRDGSIDAIAGATTIDEDDHSTRR